MYRLIETERLFIRPLRITDKGFILELLNTQGWLKFIGDRNIRDEKDAEKYIQNVLDNENYFYNIFELKESKRPIGLVTFLYRDSQVFPDIGFAMLPKFDKKGYAFEATKKYLDEVFNENRTKKIIAMTLPTNTKSIRLIKKLGLKFEYAFVQDLEVLHLYSIEIT